MDAILEAKKEIIAIGKKLSTSGVVGTFEGNISRRVGDKVILTPSGKNKEELDETKLATTDLDGKWIDGPWAPTSETPMHTAVYKMRPDVKAIVHCHAPFATAFALANEPIEIMSSPEFIILYEKVPVIPYGTPGSKDIYKGMDKELAKYDVVLLANHGMLAVGKTALEAYSKCISLEMLLKTYFIKQQLFPNKNTDLSAAEIAKLKETGKTKHGPQPE